jgi:hypothetical protein
MPMLYDSVGVEIGEDYEDIWEPRRGHVAKKIVVEGTGERPPQGAYVVFRGDGRHEVGGRGVYSHVICPNFAVARVR